MSTFSLISLLGLVLLASCYGSKQIALEQSFKENADSWEANTKGGLLSIGKTSFGPYVQTNAVKLDSPKFKTTPKFFKISLFGHDDSTKKRLVYDIDVASGNDKASVLLYLWKVTKAKQQGIFSKKNEELPSEKKNAAGFITINEDSSRWEFEVGPYTDGIPGDDDVYHITKGFLRNNHDHFTIEAVTEFSDGKTGGYGYVTKGIFVKNIDGEPLGALQMRGKYAVWMKKNLPAAQQLAIASLFIVVLSTKDK